NVEMIRYRARAVPEGIEISQNATSFRPPHVAYDWRKRLDPWLRAGNPQGCAYLAFGTESAFIRWQPTAVARLDWRSALVRVGQSSEFTGSYALELPDPEGSGFGADGAFQPGE